MYDIAKPVMNIYIPTKFHGFFELHLAKKKTPYYTHMHLCIYDARYHGLSYILSTTVLSKYYRT